MMESITAYFEDKVIPLIASKHPEIIRTISIRVEGSVGLGLNDDLSDMEAMIYLPENLWNAYGGQLQLSLIHSLEPFCIRSRSHVECPGDPYSWMHFGHPEINVHPRNELLLGQAEYVVAGEKDIPWDDLGLEELHQIQTYPILRDAGGFLTCLKEKTMADMYPNQLWTKHLIHELAELKGEPWDLEKAIQRDRLLEAQMILGTMIPSLLRVTFLINRQYYPWRKYLYPFFKRLPFLPAELLQQFEIVESDKSLDAKASAASRIVHILTDMILDKGMMSSGMLEYLFDARNEKAWDNPDWRKYPDLCRQKAKDAGYDWLDGWIWAWWGWNE